MPNYTIPHTAQFLPVKSIYTTQFNSAGDGQYTFNTSGEILKTTENTVYYFESYEISGNIDHNEFQSAININPQLFVKQRLGNSISIARSLAVSQFGNEKDLGFFIKINKKDDYIDGLLTGKLFQTADLIGKEEITININFNIFAMNDKIFVAHFADSIKMGLSTKINRG